MVDNPSQNMEVDETVSRESVLALIDLKHQLEKEIGQIKEVLDLNGVGMLDSLVDENGFPRDDIDVYNVRHARHKIICLTNDIKDLTKEIEEGLHKVHAQARESGEPMEQVMTPRRDITDHSPIAQVNLVREDSPAAAAGICVGDLILKFGTVSDSNFSSLKDIAKVVEHSVNRKVAVVVQRDSVIQHISLTPKSWSGAGFLGCNILPIESVDR